MELFDRLADENYTMTEAEAINYVRQICEAIQHMHDLNIVHLDLKVKTKFVFKFNLIFQLFIF